MQVTVEIQLEQHPRVIRRTPRIRTLRSGKAQPAQIQRARERIQEPHRILRRHVFLQPFGKEQRLRPVQSSSMIHT